MMRPVGLTMGWMGCLMNRICWDAYWPVHPKFPKDLSRLVLILER